MLLLGLLPMAFLSYYPRGPEPRAGTAHNELGAPIINQENAPQFFPQVNLRGHFLNLSSFFQNDFILSQVDIKIL